MTRTGVFGARADNRGLHRQLESFCKWVQPDRVFGLDLTVDNLSPYPCDWSGYNPDTLTVRPHSQMDESEVRSWLRGLDVVFGAETFYRQEFYEWCKAERVRTVLQINPEFLPPYWVTGQGVPEPRPDVLVAPTTWLLNKLPGIFHLPFPVDRTQFPFQLRTRADRFVHIAGHRAAGDRAGTRILLQAVLRMRNIDVTLRTQSDLGFSAPALNRMKVEHANLPNPAQLYEGADVVILPRRYGGQCLSMNEALSCGIPVITLDRHPENTWGGVLPVRARIRGSLRTKGGMYKMYDVADRGKSLSEAMLGLRDNPDRVEELSRAADKYADSISWESLLPVYHTVLKTIAEGHDISYVL